MHKTAIARAQSSTGGVVQGSAQRKLAQLYARHSRSALRLAYLMTGNSTAAEDVVQEAFARMYARFQDRKAPDAIEAYLRRSVINLAHDRHRRQRTMRAFVTRSAAQSEAHAPDIDARLAMRSRLQRLPHRQRAALVLRYYEDLSEHQSAEILNCSVPALKQLVQRGLKALREQDTGDNDE